MKSSQSLRSAVITLERLTPAQQRVAAALLQGATMAEAARSSDVGRTTVYRWCRDNPAFRAALDASQRVHSQYIADELRGLVRDSFLTLRSVIRDAQDNVRLRAAMAVLDRSSRIGHNQAEPIEHLRAKIDAIAASIPETEFERARNTLKHNGTLFKTARR